MSQSLQANLEPNFFKQNRSTTYGILGHEDHESINIPINPNLLNFVSPIMEKSYIKGLYCDSRFPKSPSREFKNNLLYFYIYVTIYIAILIIFSILLNSEGVLSDKHLLFHLTFLCVILMIAYLILLGLYKSPYCLSHSRILLLIIGSIFLTYLILSDERILSEIINEEHSKSSIPSSIGIVCWIVMMRNVLFDSFTLTACLSISAVLLFFGLSLAYSPLNVHSIIAEALLMLLFLSLHTFDCHAYDYRSRQLF